MEQTVGHILGSGRHGPHGQTVANTKTIPAKCYSTDKNKGYYMQPRMFVLYMHHLVVFQPHETLQNTSSDLEVVNS